MLDPRVGMKIYDNVWYLRHRLEPDPSRRHSRRHGGNLRSDSEPACCRCRTQRSTARSTPEEAARYATLDDRAFRDALSERGIAYFASLNIGFDPKFIAAHPELLPIDQFGRREEPIDWYIGLPPDRRANIDHKIALLEPAVRVLEPDGVHLGFIRWPGFWEIWLPDVDRASMPDYCYSHGTLERFCSDTKTDLPINDPVAAARRIASEHRNAWRDWKCSMTEQAVGNIRNALTAIKPDIEIAINTLPLFNDDFDNAVEEVFGAERIAPERGRRSF